MFGDLIDIKIESPDAHICPDKQLELRALAVFQDIDELGNYTDQMWFQTLGRVQLISSSENLQIYGHIEPIYLLLLKEKYVPQ